MHGLAYLVTSCDHPPSRYPTQPPMAHMQTGIGGALSSWQPLASAPGPTMAGRDGRGGGTVNARIPMTMAPDFHIQCSDQNCRMLFDARTYASCPYCARRGVGAGQIPATQHYGEAPNTSDVGITCGNCGGIYDARSYNTCPKCSAGSSHALPSHPPQHYRQLKKGFDILFTIFTG